MWIVNWGHFLVITYIEESFSKLPIFDGSNNAKIWLLLLLKDLPCKIHCLGWCHIKWPLFWRAFKHWKTYLFLFVSWFATDDTRKRRTNTDSKHWAGPPRVRCFFFRSRVQTPRNRKRRSGLGINLIWSGKYLSLHIWFHTMFYYVLLDMICYLLNLL